MIMIKKISILSLGVLLSFGSFARDKKPTEAPKNQPSKSTITEKVKACKKQDGLFPLYQDTSNGAMYLLVKKDLLNKKFIYFSYTENGVVAAGHFRGSFRDNMVFTIKRYFDRIEFIEQNTEFYFDTTNAISKAADANISNAVLVSQKILAEENGSMLLDANAIFLGENMSQIKPTPFPGSMGQMSLLGMLNKEKSKYIKTRNYPANTDIVVEYVYDNPSPLMSGGKEVANARAVSITYQHSFIQAPEIPMQPRRDDQRIGYFGQQKNDMTTTNAVAYKDIIHRWRLEKKENGVALSEPVKPITWWIENTTPKEFRPIIKSAGEQWNIAFEAAGYKNAVVVLEQPDTATWDAGDIYYNVLRWTSSPQPPFGGYGPSFVDPRTGEILGADIMLEYIFVTNRINQEKLFDAPQPSSFNSNLPDHMQMCEAGHHLHLTSMFGNSVIEARGLSSIEKREYMTQSLYYLVMHEMGHTMGLMHNMKASQLWSPAQAHNKELTRKYGLIASVMEYPAVNLSNDKTKQGDYFTTRPGPYDLWAITYGYSSASEDLEVEENRLTEILNRSSDSTLIFGNDADDMRSPGKGVDPRVNINDFSNDVITYSIDRIKLINKMLPELPKRYIAKGKSYQELKQAFGISISEMANATQSISRYIGGLYIDRHMQGNPAYTPVSLAEQKRAMNALSQYLFSPKAFDAANGLYQNLQSQRRGFNFFGAPDDPKIHDRVLLVQTMVIDHLLAPTTLKRITDSRLYGNKYGVVDVLNDLTNACFKEDIGGNVNTFRQNLQIEYVKELSNIVSVNKPNSSYDNVAKSAVIGQLKSIKKMMTLLAVNAEVNAHREHVLLIIDEALSRK